VVKRKKWISADKRPIVTVTGSRKKTIVFGCLSLDGKQLFRQYDKFDSNTFVDYLKHRYRKDLVNTSYLLIELHLTVQRLQEDFLILISIPSDWNIFLLVLQSLMQ
jgi:hypothetical protein